MSNVFSKEAIKAKVIYSDSYGNYGYVSLVTIDENGRRKHFDWEYPGEKSPVKHDEEVLSFQIKGLRRLIENSNL